MESPRLFGLRGKEGISQASGWARRACEKSVETSPTRNSKCSVNRRKRSRATVRSTASTNAILAHAHTSLYRFIHYSLCSLRALSRATASLCVAVIYSIRARETAPRSRRVGLLTERRALLTLRASALPRPTLCISSCRGYLAASAEYLKKNYGGGIIATTEGVINERRLLP